MLVSELTVIKHVYETYFHEYGHDDQSIGAFCSFCIICVQLMIVVDQLNLEHTEALEELLEDNHTLTFSAINI